MQKYSGVAQDPAGNVISSTTVTVNLAGSSTPATIFSTNTFTTLANPFTANADGTYAFYTHGRVDIVLTKTGYTFSDAETADVFLYDPMSALSFTLSADTNDYAPTNGAFVSMWRMTATTPLTLTGILAGYAGQVMTFVNIGVSAITLANDSGSSAAGNRIFTGGTDLVLDANQAGVLQYDLTSAHWRIVGSTIPGAAGSPAAEITGVIKDYGGDTAPAGYLLCDGAEVSRSTYSALFAVIGETFGVGNGTTTFNVPSLKGRIAVGYDATQTEFNALGKTGGEKTHALTVPELAAHSHTTSIATGSGGTGVQQDYVFGAASDTGYSSAYVQNASVGSGTAHNNIQPYLTVNKIIKT